MVLRPVMNEAVNASNFIVFDLNKYFNAFKNLFAVQLLNNANLGPPV